MNTQQIQSVFQTEDILDIYREEFADCLQVEMNTVLVNKDMIEATLNDLMETLGKLPEIENEDDRQEAIAEAIRAEARSDADSITTWDEIILTTIQDEIEEPEDEPYNDDIDADPNY